METRSVFVVAASTVVLLSACASTPRGPSAKAELVARSGSTVSGTVRFREVDGNLLVEAKVAGLTPGEHGFHVHEVGDCSAPDASSAKGHFNPGATTHGFYGNGEHHAGDLPNLLADARGEALYSAEVTGLDMSGESGVSGRSVVIHADPDDYRSQPAGNSGNRIACGVIVEL